MVQWKVLPTLNERQDSPMFHWTMIMGGRVIFLGYGFLTIRQVATNFKFLLSKNGLSDLGLVNSYACVCLMCFFRDCNIINHNSLPFLEKMFGFFSSWKTAVAVIFFPSTLPLEPAIQLPTKNGTFLGFPGKHVLKQIQLMCFTQGLPNLPLLKFLSIWIIDAEDLANHLECPRSLVFFIVTSLNALVQLP